MAYLCQASVQSMMLYLSPSGNKSLQLKSRHDMEYYRSTPWILAIVILGGTANINFAPFITLPLCSDILYLVQ